VGVFNRQGAGRLPILEKRVISIPSMFGQSRITQEVEKVVADNCHKVFNHELQFYLNRGR